MRNLSIALSLTLAALAQCAPAFANQNDGSRDDFSMHLQEGYGETRHSLNET